MAARAGTSRRISAPGALRPYKGHRPSIDAAEDTWSAAERRPPFFRVESAARSGSQARGGENLIDATTIEVHDLEAPLIDHQPSRASSGRNCLPAK